MRNSQREGWGEGQMKVILVFCCLGSLCVSGAQPRAALAVCEGGEQRHLKQSTNPS